MRTENRKGTSRFRVRPLTGPPCKFFLSFSVFLLLAGGCAAPGEPRPPLPVIPAAVTDLAARQLGDGVALTFTLPQQATDGETLAAPPDIEIFRGYTPAGASLKKVTTRLVYTVPSALVDTYLAEGRIHFVDPLPPEELRAHAGEPVVYMVRTRAAKRRASADSNGVSLRVYPVPERITDAYARVTETAIELSWTAPAHTTVGAPLAEVSGYRVYRGEIDPGTAPETAQDASKANLKAPMALLAPASAASYRDTQFEFGKTYLYSIRSVAPADSGSVESGDSVPVIVPARDTFPPGPPQNVVVVLVPPAQDVPLHAELSWAISPESDWAGYRVYRSEKDSAGKELLAHALLSAPAYRDMSVLVGHRYVYQVTAVDRAGNESAPSAAVSLDVVQPLP